MPLFNKKPQPAPPEDRILSPLERSYFWLSDVDPILGEDMVRHIFVSGMTGSGKTSSSGKEILKSLIRNGDGGLVLCSKGGPDGDAATVYRYCEELGRTDDIIELGAGCGHSIDFLMYAYLLSREMYAVILPDMLTMLLEVGARRTGSASDPFWEDAPKMLSRALCSLAVIASDGKPTLGILHDALMTAPKSLEELGNANWRAQSTCMQLLEQAEANATKAKAAGDSDVWDQYQKTMNYFTRRWVNIPDRTRESIAITWEASVDVLLRPPLKSLLASGEITVSPEQTFEERKIIVVNFPTTQDLEVGLFANMALKYLWGLAIMQRDIQRDSPISFLYADEIQEFLHPPTDQRMLSVCRGFRGAIIYLSQNIDSLYSVLGGDRSRHQVNSLLQNMALKIAHANSGETNEWIAQLIGMEEMVKTEISMGESENEYGEGQSSRNLSTRRSREFLVPPEVLSSQLRTGGTRNNGFCDAVCFMPSRAFGANGGANHMITSFIQDWALEQLPD